MAGAVGVAIGAALATGPTLFAQFSRAPRSDAPIVSGDDIGFRIEDADPRTGAPTGTWMVRVGGKWVEVGAMSGIKPAR